VIRNGWPKCQAATACKRSTLDKTLDGRYHMTEDCISMESLEELQEACTRLQVLVSELLRKNQELRIQLAAEEDGLRELHLL
jgi:hypothetical protein